MRTPSSALLMFRSENSVVAFLWFLAGGHRLVPRPMPEDVLFLAKHALRVEVADPAALAARSRVDHRVDQSGFAGVHGRFDGPLQRVGGFRLHADATEGLDDLVVPRAFDEDG